MHKQGTGSSVLPSQLMYLIHSVYLQQATERPVLERCLTRICDVCYESFEIIHASNEPRDVGAELDCCQLFQGVAPTGVEASLLCHDYEMCARMLPSLLSRRGVIRLRLLRHLSHLSGTEGVAREP